MLVNHANRSDGEAGNSGGELLTAYLAATATSLSVAVGLQAAGARYGGGALVRFTVPMLAVSLGSTSNLVMTRRAELYQGVPVHSADGTPLGNSLAAARIALAECCAVRVAWTVLLLSFAPLLSALARRSLPRRLAAGRAAPLATEALVNFGVIWASVPLCMAIFPQREQVEPQRLEPEFGRHPATGEELRVVYFNKGL